MKPQIQYGAIILGICVTVCSLAVNAQPAIDGSQLPKPDPAFTGQIGETYVEGYHFNTLIFYIVGDNGASAEGGLEGTFSEIASLLGVQLGLQSTIERIDEIGGPTSELEVPAGKVTIRTEYAAVGPMEKGGTLRLFVNGKPAGAGTIKRVGFRSGGLEPFEIGRDSITAIAPSYKDKGDFAFTGTINKVTFELK